MQNRITPTLYKRDSTGKIRAWHIEIHEDRTKYRMVSGVDGGTMTASEWTQAKGKNIGRANETTPQSQCEFEVNAAITKKKKEGYFEDLAEVDNKTLIEPMLAKDYNDYVSELPWNKKSGVNVIFTQPKLDGIRCIATPNGLFSRKGEPIVSCPHISEIMIPIAKKYNVYFDGELYNHSLKEDFNQVASLVRKSKDIEKHIDKIKSLIQYHIYDFIVPDMSFRLRQMQLLNVGFPEINIVQGGETPFIFPVATYEVTNQELLDSLYGHFIEEGYEGQMVRHDTAYQHKRTSDLLKRKEFQDDEFEILDVLEGEGNRSGMAGKLLLRLENGETFKSNIKGGRDHYKYLLAKKEQFIGKRATIKYFHLTPDGVPRFPVCVDIGRRD